MIQEEKASTAVADLKIDFLSLDVEGYELEVLKGLDLQLHRRRAHSAYKTVAPGR